MPHHRNVVSYLFHTLDDNNNLRIFMSYHNKTLREVIKEKKEAYQYLKVTGSSLANHRFPAFSLSLSLAMNAAKHGTSKHLISTEKSKIRQVVVRRRQVRFLSCGDQKVCGTVPSYKHMQTFTFTVCTSMRYQTKSYSCVFVCLFAAPSFAPSFAPS